MQLGKLVLITLMVFGIFALSSCNKEKFGGRSNNGKTDPAKSKPGTNGVDDDGFPDDPKNTVTFGDDDKVFHIGDGRFEQTSCKQQVESYPLAGTKFFFEFETSESESEVKIDVERICGIDYDTTNLMSLSGPGNPATARPLSSGQTFGTLTNLTLDKGRYSLIIQSNLNLASPSDIISGDFGDHDDFIVGIVKIKSKKPIKSVGVRTE